MRTLDKQNSPFFIILKIGPLNRIKLNLVAASALIRMNQLSVP